MKNNSKPQTHTLNKPNLTKAEEQVMQAVWQSGKAFLKDVLEAMPEPKPHTNTLATLLKILIDKGYVLAEPSGRNNLYSAIIKKEDYSNASINNLVANYFDGSFSDAVSFLVNQKKLSVSDLEILLQQLKK